MCTYCSLDELSQSRGSGHLFYPVPHGLALLSTTIPCAIQPRPHTTSYSSSKCDHRDRDRKLRVPQTTMSAFVLLSCSPLRGATRQHSSGPVGVSMCAEPAPRTCSRRDALCVLAAVSASILVGPSAARAAQDKGYLPPGAQEFQNIIGAQRQWNEIAALVSKR